MAKRKLYQIRVEAGKSIEDTADWLAMSVSTVLDELFPGQWKQAMTLMAERINATVREERPPDGLTAVEWRAQTDRTETERQGRAVHRAQRQRRRISGTSPRPDAMRAGRSASA